MSDRLDRATVLEAKGVSVRYSLRGKGRRGLSIRAVDDVSLEVRAGETLALVGESGSGKSTLGRALIGIETLHSGEVLVDGVPRGRREWRRGRLRRDFQMVFQNPLGSLNPRIRVAGSIREPLDIHRIGDQASRDVRVRELLEMVGLDASFADLYPHAMSGGQQQRVAIARALAAEPRLIVCDEPVSSLDVSIQAQIVNLLRRLQKELELSYVFIAHDLALVRSVASRVAVMYMGKIVEAGLTEDVVGKPQHPYTRALLSAVPVPDVEIERTRRRIILGGDLPDAADPPPGCRFHTRCPWAEPLCALEEPQLRLIYGTHAAACHFAESIASNERVNAPARPAV